ncbi:hypothetical protein [Blastococcus sp. TF02A-26]|uniref:hypothetical protein n=1 Tax=Blastococcus sp. TF02A-26 TaxID=2250577 RepID=UPI000DEBD5F8|nr:hypothetical protein [Blastococcus sp. TF02A-26]RBY89830.1 hypothetical protein DQ240_02640 [Blastococcus sp. TF02A-26]
MLTQTSASPLEVPAAPEQAAAAPDPGPAGRRTALPSRPPAGNRWRRVRHAGTRVLDTATRALGSWPRVLVALGVGLLALNVVAYYPGFLSNDSIDQFGQALDTRQLDDWHPPVMTALWWVVNKLSFQTVGAMLVVQLTALWSSLVLLAVYAFRRTGLRPVSLLPLALGVLPYVANISGVIWKDTHLAFAMLGAVALLLHLQLGIGRRWLRTAAVAAVVLLLAYAGAVRYNALPALVPLLFLLRWPGARNARRARLALAGGVVVGALAVTPVIDLVRPVAATHPSSSIMLDDVMHLYTVEELADADVSPSLRRELVALAQRCPSSERDVNYTWRCASTGDIPQFLLDHPAEIRDLYLSGIAGDPLGYLHYRAYVFSRFLDTPFGESFVWWYGVGPNPYGLTFTPNAATDGLYTYVDFSFRNFGFLYKPFTWLLAGAVLLAVTWRRRRDLPHAPVVLALCASSLLYIVSYVPTVIGYDYRYVYWPAIGVTLAGLLFAADRFRSGADRRATRRADRARAVVNI